MYCLGKYDASQICEYNASLHTIKHSLSGKQKKKVFFTIIILCSWPNLAYSSSKYLVNLVTLSYAPYFAMQK